MPFALTPRFPLLLLSLLAALLLGGCAAQSHHRAGMNAMEQGAYAEAVDQLRLAVDLAPQDIAYKRDWLQNRETATRKLLAKADASLAENHLAEADEAYRSILKYDRDNPRARAGLESVVRLKRAADDALEARKAFKRGDLTQALQWASRALENAPEQPEARAIKREIEALQSKELTNTPSLGKIYKKPINLEFRDASVKMVFDALSRTTGINFIFDRDVRSDQKTTVFLKQTTLEDAIDVILTTNQLDKKILNATSILIYPNNAAKSKEYQDLMVRAFYLANVEAKQTAAMLKAILKLKDVFVDDKYNMLVVRDNPEAIALAEKLISLHDLDEPEVMLEVEVLEINRSKLLNLGIQLSNQLTVTPLSNLISGNATGTAGTGGGTSSPTIKLSDLKRLNSDLLGITLPSATINLQKTDGDANLLANPRLRVRDREKAKIMIGDKVPVVTTTSSPNGFVAENIQYLEVGLKLEVEPTIHLHDEIGLKLGLEVSSLVSSIKTNNGSQAYQIGTRNLSTALHLKDGETQILAGLINDEDRSSANRIPLIGDLPLVGRLFSSQSDNRQKTEIVMSITPHLIRNIQRKDPGAESFWSGTETTLRSKPLQLRNAEAVSVQNEKNQAKANTETPPDSGAKPAPAANDGKLNLQWKGAQQGQVGQPLALELHLDSAAALRALPFQLAFNPNQFEVASIQEGDYFSKTGKASFSHVIDKASGRVSVGVAVGEGTGANGKGRLLSIVLKPLAPNQEAEVSVIGMTPVGVGTAMQAPPLPATYKIQIAP